MTTPETVLISFVAGLAVAVVTTPVGVSGAVFLLPIQFSVLQVPSPAVTPTNLLFNIVAIPGALARYRRQAPTRSSLTTALLAGTVPGVVIGALIRVFLIPGPRLFRLVIAALLFPLGIWLCLRNQTPPHPRRAQQRRPSNRSLGVLGLAVGVVGGIYGIGGGSLLSPILVGESGAPERQWNRPSRRKPHDQWIDCVDRRRHHPGQRSDTEPPWQPVLAARRSAAHPGWRSTGDGRRASSASTGSR